MDQKVSIISGFAGSANAGALFNGQRPNQTVTHVSADGRELTKGEAMIRNYEIAIQQRREKPEDTSNYEAPIAEVA